ncbi:MAG: hypothetical protein K9M75_10930 [Phycisphaerae bacterium]|nr:hypothetical protein [Phycisphaerae bacterium]
MRSMNIRKRKVSLKLVLAVVVLSAVVLPFVASAFAARNPVETDGFLNPFDLTLSPIKAIEFGVADPLDIGRGPSMSAPTPAATPPARPILVPYRPRPRSPIWF